MTKIIIFLTLLVTTLMATYNTRAIVRITDKQGKQIIEYTGSYALLIGVSDYTKGWPDLESIPSELKNIQDTLETKGFKVTYTLNPNSKELEDAYEDFIDKYGYDENNRLVFFYSGHGYSVDNGSKGYLVPTDAPNPNKDIKNFKRKSLNMTSLLALSRKIEAKHALFLFDSCFSGTIFKTRALPKTPPYIKKSMAKPVRQFITAGSAGEEVPAKSTFSPMFIDAITGDADLNKDGYITGSELGMYLSTNVPKYRSQSPQYGKISDYELSRGDFIFFNPMKKKEVLKSTQNVENELWDMVKNSNSIEDYTYYISTYPNGRFIAIANFKIKKLKPKHTIKKKLEPKYFLFKDKLTQKIKSEIEEYLDLYSEPKSRHLKLEGNTDSYRSDEYNFEFALENTMKVKNFLVKELGYKKELISIVSYGKTNPICTKSNHNKFKKPCTEINSRVTIRQLLSP